MWDDLHKDFRSPKPNLEELKKKIADWKEAREDRRRDHRMRLIKRWGHHIGKPDVNAELKLHALRVARLERMEEIVGTEKTGDARQKLLDRIEKLRKAEDERHQRAMERLASGAAAPGPSASAEPAAAAPAASAPAAAPSGGAQ